MMTAGEALRVLRPERWDFLHSLFMEELETTGERISLRSVARIEEGLGPLNQRAAVACYRKALAEAKANGWIK